MATTSDVVGKSPLTYTDSFGAQKSVPLSAFELSGTTIQFKSTWAPTPAPTAEDLAVIAALGSAKVAAGEFTAPPVAPAMPAMAFTAAAAGPEGNKIGVALTVGTGSALSAPLSVDVTETDTYAGMTDAASAALVVGVDVATADFPRVGTGLVQVQAASVAATGVPLGGPSFNVSQVTPVLAADGVATLFNLIPRPGYAGPPVTVTVTVNADGTFTLLAEYDSGAQDVGTLLALAPPANVSFLVDIGPAPGGFALPAASTFQLSGGATGIAARALVYTD